MKRERNKEAEKQRAEQHGQRMKEKRNNYREQEVIEKASQRVQRTYQVVKGGNENTKIRVSLYQYRRRNWFYLHETETACRHCLGQENLGEAEMQEKARELGSVSLLSSRKENRSPGFCVSGLCTFPPEAHPHANEGSGSFSC